MIVMSSLCQNVELKKYRPDIQFAPKIKKKLKLTEKFSGDFFSFENSSPKIRVQETFIK